MAGKQAADEGKARVGYHRKSNGFVPSNAFSKTAAFRHAPLDLIGATAREQERAKNPVSCKAAQLKEHDGARFCGLLSVQMCARDGAVEPNSSAARHGGLREAHEAQVEEPSEADLAMAEAEEAVSAHARCTLYTGRYGAREAVANAR